MPVNRPLDDYFGVEYNGRKALIQRNPDYQATIQAIHLVFNEALMGVPPEKIIISAYVGELEDSFEIHPKDWNNLLPCVNRATIILINTTPTPTDTHPLPVTEAEVHPIAPEPAQQQAHPAVVLETARSASVLYISDSDDEAPIANPIRNASPSSSRDNTLQDRENDVRIKQERAKEQQDLKRKREVNDGSESELTDIDELDAEPRDGGTEKELKSYTLTRDRSKRASSDLSRSSVKNLRAQTPESIEWSGKPRGNLFVRGHTGTQNNPYCGQWSFSKKGVTLGTAHKRSVGDIHFSYNLFGKGGFRYWVVEGDGLEQRWVLRQAGDIHPAFPEHNLRPCNGTTPPGWITPISLYNFYERESERE